MTKTATRTAWQTWNVNLDCAMHPQPMLLQVLSEGSIPLDPPCPLFGEAEVCREAAACLGADLAVDMTLLAPWWLPLWCTMCRSSARCSAAGRRCGGRRCGSRRRLRWAPRSA